MITPRLLATAVSLSLACSAMADPTLRLYDVRDLAAVLPVQGMTSLPPSPFGTPIDVDQREKMTLRRAEALMELPMMVGANRPEPPKSAVDEFMDQLCASLSVGHTKLAEGVYTVQGEQNQHQQLSELLSSTFELYRGKYELDLVCFVAKAADAPAVGSSPTGVEPLCRARATMGKRVPLLIEAVERMSYIEDWTPVVSEQVAGFDPQTAVIEKGMRLTVTVGGADVQPEDSEAAPVFVRMNGTIADVKLLDREVPGVGGGPPSPFVTLPASSTRSVNSELKLPPGKSAVVAVVPGFAPGEVIVIAATVTPLR